MTKKLARESMSKKLVTINFNENMETACKRMRKRKLRHLPVCDDTGEIVGMLSDRDVQRAMISEIKHEPPSPASSESIEFDPEARVRDYMGWPVLTIEQDSDIRLVAERLLQEKVSALLVTNGRATVGIVTTDDLMKVLIDLLGDPKTPARWTLQGILENAGHRMDGFIF
ncbi:MAG: CBS domain-containing protein [Deltaproteobacteria bacterium]|nr:CBS domain-containing protein [Deltaproteobacteria bacterium]